ncbi:hypothetical protein [Nostoc sp.]|jgi:hypothetical protein|uniref:hypothetical protein n=1 Tax=Nostoc sp. TaxID=1180 RepID=UPI002FF8528A
MKIGALIQIWYGAIAIYDTALNGTLEKRKRLSIKQFVIVYVIHAGVWSSRGKFWGDVYELVVHYRQSDGVGDRSQTQIRHSYKNHVCSDD